MMPQQPGARPPHGMLPGDCDHQDWAADWAAIWQSELAALAVDREAHEGLVAFATAWARAWSATRERVPLPEHAGRNDGAAGCAGSDAASGAAPAHAGADARDEQIEQLRRRIAELERRA